MDNENPINIQFSFNFHSLQFLNSILQENNADTPTNINKKNRNIPKKIQKEYLNNITMIIGQD
jgi:hypothetical protein